MQYLALLRGINVGGRNLVKMADLRAAFEALGFADVATYIQSGNVLFRSRRERRAELAGRIEAELSVHFGAELRVVVLAEEQLRRAVKGAPSGFGDGSDLCDVLFLRPPLTVRRALSAVETREGVDRVWAGEGVVYFARLAAKASSSRLAKVVARPEYQNMTIRSWSTTTKLLGLMDSRSAGKGSSPP